MKNGRCEMKANVKSVLMKKYRRVYQAGAKLLMAAGGSEETAGSGSRQRIS